MTHTFLIDGATATMSSKPQPDGSLIEIACKSEQGEDVRLRLVFSGDGFDRFRELFEGFSRSTLSAKAHAGVQERTPAAEPTSGAAAAHAGDHIDRYAVSRMAEPELNRAVGALRPYQDGKSAEEYGGANRIVMWRVTDSDAGSADSARFRVYLSPGALRALQAQGVQVQLEGEISRREVPQGRELLIGDPPMDWQDTSSYPT